MQSSHRRKLRKTTGLEIGPKVRDLRLARKWTQAELARQLGLSQARLSELERGAGSFTAEQLIEILRLFNVHISHFAPAATKDADAELQNTLARLGASHLLENDALPSDRIVNANDAIRESLVLGAPRLVTALAPVLVRNTKLVNLPRIHSSLRELGLAQRLGWLVDNVLEAIRDDVSRGRSPRDAARYRRAAMILETYRDLARAQEERGASAPDVLEEDIRTKKTLDEVRAESSPISRHWNIVTRLQPADFLEALRAARAVD